MDIESQTSCPGSVTKQTEKVFENMKFPHKLWNIVNSCMTGAISWNRSGTTILVNSEQFQEEYLEGGAATFKTKNMASFIRQLNLYGFRKVTSRTRDAQDLAEYRELDEFRHADFTRDQPDLLGQLTRRTGALKLRQASKDMRGGSKKQSSSVVKSQAAFRSVLDKQFYSLRSPEDETLSLIDQLDEFLHSTADDDWPVPITDPEQATSPPPAVKKRRTAPVRLPSSQREVQQATSCLMRQMRSPNKACSAMMYPRTTSQAAEAHRCCAAWYQLPTGVTQWHPPGVIGGVYLPPPPGGRVPLRSVGNRMHPCLLQRHGNLCVDSVVRQIHSPMARNIYNALLKDNRPSVGTGARRSLAKEELL